MTTILLTDSMDKIQKKLNKGGEIKFQYGTYKITKQLILKNKSNINLNGAVLRRNASIQSIFLNECSAKTKAYKGAGNITIYNGTFEGMGSYSHDNLVTFFHSHDILIENVTFLDNLCHALEINSSKNVEIANCKFLGNNTEKAYKEIIQIDGAYAVGFWLNGSTKKSKCYDGTMCEDIIITGCEFNKSKYRNAPSVCIGTHTQLVGGKQHKDIQILHNTFVCDGSSNCISLIGMRDVYIYSNYFTHCGRIVKIFNKDHSYSLTGDPVYTEQADGICENIKIKDNVKLDAAETFKCSCVYGVSVSEEPHIGIEVISNKFEKDNDYEKYYLYTENCKDVISKGNMTTLKMRGV